MTRLLAVFDIVPGWCWAAAVVALLAVGCQGRAAHRADLAQAKSETAAVTQTLERERRAAADRAREESDAARAREQALQKEADAARKADQNEIRRIAAQRDRALDELRRRPARPPASAAADSVPPNPGAGPTAAGCTGAGLYREDAEFLVGESARSETLRAALLSCYAAHDRARAASINEVTPMERHAPRH